MEVLNRQGSLQFTDVPLLGDFPLDQSLAFSWVEALVFEPPPAISAIDYLVLLGWYREFMLMGIRPSRSHRDSQQGHRLLVRAISEASARNPNWAAETTLASHPDTYAANTKKHDAVAALQRMPSELWEAFTAPTNIGGTLVALGLTADALIQSLPLRWHVTMQRGVWELYDENANLRMGKYGKAAIGRAKIPPRLVLRARGARISWMWQAGARVGTNSTRFPVNGAKTVGDALRILKADSMKMISKDALDALKFRAKLGGTAVGLALTTLPQAYVDARDSGLFEHQDAARWRQFAVQEAKNQSANLAGFAAGMIVGAAVAALVTSAAPVVIVTGLVAGAVVQSGFNAWGLSDDVGTFAQTTFFGR